MTVLGNTTTRIAKRRLASAGLLLALILAVPGCGGSSSATLSTSATTPEASRFINAADVICARLNAELIVASPAHLDLRSIARSAPGNATLELTSLHELRKLSPPPSLASGWRQIIAYRRTLAAELVAVARAAKAGDAAAVQALGVSKAKVHRKLFALATREGFKQCSQIVSGRGKPAEATPFSSAPRPVAG